MTDDYDGPPDGYDLTATCKCTNCGREFETSANEEGSIAFDGVRKHGKRYNEEHKKNDDRGKGRWDYEIIDRPDPSDGDK